MITKDQALDLIRAHVKNENIVKHILALGAVMAAFYDHFQPEDGSTGDEWYIAGLLHDGDYCEGVPDSMQGVTITQWAKDAGYQIPENVAHAMAAHNWSNTGVEPVSQMDWSIFCADSLTGLITACTLVLPTKKLADVKLESILKKFKQPSFASGTRREDIQMCETKLNIPLDQFISISLSAMQSASEELGL